MPIPTSRAKENAQIVIDEENCNGCGLCVSACSDDSLTLVNKKWFVSPWFLNLMRPFWGKANDEMFRRKASLFREKHGIKYASREGLFVAFGYPAIKFRKGIKRTFAAVDFHSQQ